MRLVPPATKTAGNESANASGVNAASPISQRHLIRPPPPRRSQREKQGRDEQIDAIRFDFAGIPQSRVAHRENANRQYDRFTAEYKPGEAMKQEQTGEAANERK